MKKAIWKRILTIMLAAAMLITSMPTSVWATVSQNADQETEAVYRVESGTADIFNGTTITLSGLTLKAAYKDDSGTHVVELTENGNFELPYNADINMRLDFVLGTADAVDAGTSYVYRLPTSIRVDVEATHPLSDGEGNSIGTVHIAKDGTLSFNFDTDAIGTSKNTGFYVQFDGGFSEDLQEAGKEADISFPTSGGSFDFSVTTTDTTEETEDPEPKDVEIYKSGARIVNENGQNYIEWTIELGPNGRDALDGVISDTLASGLTYVPGSAALVDAYEGTVTENCSGQNVELTLSGVKTWYHAKVKFHTYYDAAIFNSVNNNTSQIINNTAIFNPDDGTAGVVDEGSVTITPDMVEKSGSSVDSDGNITWTVVLNKEKLNLKGATFSDIFGTGLEALNDEGDIQITPALPGDAVVTVNDTGFSIQFSNNTDTSEMYTITYATHVSDFSQPSFTNQAKLTGGADVAYDVTKDASVSGYNLLQKNCNSYNEITNTFTWEIVVNASAVEMNNVEVTDIFDSSKMEFISASETLAAGSDLDNGKLVFSLGTLTEQKVITVTTRIKDPESYINSGSIWQEFKNKASMISSLNAVPIEKEASRWVEIKKPDLISKDGQIKDGIIEWTVTVKEPQLTVEGIVFSDVLPEDTEYIPGTFKIQNMYYDANPLYREPSVVTDLNGVQTISYTLDDTNDAEKAFYEKGFWIQYQTKVTDIDKATTDSSYTNNAQVSIDYEGDITLKDDAPKTVSGVVGGVINKTYSYKSGNQYVDWTVAINEAGNDMSTITNPKITDQLADYFDYVSGALYLVGADGQETEVDKGDYLVSVVNGRLTVQLPVDADGKYIGSSIYRFKFRTNFNCLAAELDGKRITNTASFTGAGKEYTKESSSIDNVSFSSSSAGAVIRREIRIKKVDADNPDKVLPGAKFELYLGSECIGEAESGADGYAVFEDLNSMTGYTLKLLETSPPDGYQTDGSGVTEITGYTEENLKTDSNGVRYYEVVISNSSLTAVDTGNINIKKVNGEGSLLSGAVFGLYSDAACDDAHLLQKRTTVNGLSSFSKLALGTYYLKEISSPEGYKVSNDVVTVVVAKNGADVEVSYDGAVQDSFTVTNENAAGRLVITKQDETDPAVTLDGAVFSIYKDANCTDRVDTQTTVSGKLTFENLELGRTYYYREETAPSDYVLDTEIHQITIGTGKEVTDQTESVTVTNEKAVGNIVIRKVDDSTVSVPLSDVEFTLYQSDGVTECDFDNDGTADRVTTDQKGTAVFENIPFGSYVIKETQGKEGYQINVTDTPVTVSAVGNQEVTVVNALIKCDIKVVKYDQDEPDVYLSGAEFGLYTSQGVQVSRATTNDAGEAYFRDIPYGEYTIRELGAPDDYKLSGNVITISPANIVDAANNGIAIERSLANEREKGKIVLSKQGEVSDGAGGTTIENLDGAAFTLYDENMLPVASDVSDGTGQVVFEDLAYGTYYIQETGTPDGYVRDPGLYKVVVASDDVVSEYVQDDGTTEQLTIVNKLSYAPYVSFKIKKTDSETNAPLSDATFELYKNGNPTGITAVTGSDGIAYFKRVHVENDPEDTIYDIREIAVPTGYVKTSSTIELGNRVNMNTYADPVNAGDPNLTNDQIKWAKGSETQATVTNDPMKGKIWITKTGLTSGVLLGGAEFTLYEADKTTPVAGISNPVTTNASGVAAFDDLPRGTYYLKETKAPKGYTLNATETKVVVVDDSTLTYTFKDTPVNVSVSKKVVGGTEEVAGAVLRVVKASDESVVIDRWTSTSSPHRIPFSVLEAGETYILREETAPAGYGYMSDVTFKVENDGSITTAAEKNGQTIIVRDQPIELHILKEGSDAPGVALSGAILALYDQSGKELTRFTSGTTAYSLPSGLLTAPKNGYNYYTLKEISAPGSYELAEDITIAVASDGTVYRAEETGGIYSYTALTNATLVMTDTKKLSTDMYIRKLDADTGADLSGAEFAIYEENDLSNAIVTWTSNGRPHKLSTTAFTQGSTYVLQEISAPAGYVTATAIKFTVGADNKITIVTGNADNINADRDTILVRDQGLELKIRKQDSFGTYLKGATLKISEYDIATQKTGAEIVTFTTGTESYTVLPRSLHSDASYILQELDAPDGYHLADDIVFTIDRYGKITREDGIPVYNNTIVMEDDEAGLGIGKFALESKDGLAGSTLQLTAVDDPYFTTQTWVSDGHVKTWDLTDFTPGCTYILTEINAPYGYAYTDPIMFTIGAGDHQIYIDGEKVSNRTVRIEDAKLKLAVSKQDLYSKEELAGAELVILDQSGQTVASWTSVSARWDVDTSRLIAGKDGGYAEYTLRETKAPTGYNLAEDIQFAIDRDGNIYYVTEDSSGARQYTKAEDNHLVIYDEPQLSITKLDTSGNPVSGAKLTVTAKDDGNFTPISWVSQGEPMYFANDVFTPGVTYVLTETEAPKGYAYAQSMEFTVGADGEVSVNGETIENKRIVMLDYPIKVYVNKVDASGGQSLAGAKMVVKNGAGEIIYSFVSQNQPVLLPSEIFTAPKPGEMSYYTLAELEAPTGYEVAADMGFAIDSTGQLYIRNEKGEYVLSGGAELVMKDQPSPGAPGQPGNGITTTVPKTGDNTPLSMLIAFCIIGLAGGCTVFGFYFYRRRKNR